MAPRKVVTAVGSVIVDDVVIPSGRQSAAGTIAIQLMHTPEQKWHWREPRESDSPLELVRCIGANVGSTERSAADVAHLDALLRRLKGWEAAELESVARRSDGGACGSSSDGSCSGSGSCHTTPAPAPAPAPSESGPFWSRMMESLSTSVAARWESAREARRGRRIGGAHLLASHCDDFESRAAGAESGSSGSGRNREQGSELDCSVTLKELVLGAEDMSIFAASQAALEAAGARRHPGAPAVWRLPASGHTPSSPAVRLIPSRYSALVFHAPAPLLELETALASRQCSVSLYGVRRGDEESGQLALTLPALHPLDIRFCASQRHAAFFNERPETMSDDVDPATNPPADAPSKQVAMACPSVVGMEVRSTIRRRVQEL